MEHVLEIRNLKKLYKNGRGVEEVNLTVDRGDVVGLLGPNGSGKTTTMRVVTGLSVPNSGTVKIFGTEIQEDHEKAMEKVGCLIEMPALYGNLTAWQNLKMAARYYDNVDNDRIRYILTLVHLDRYRNDKAGRFSLGMKQRLGLALALLSDPELVILDEPANGLDIEGIIQVREIITKLAAERGVTFLVSSHIASELEKTCNKVAVLHEGQMLTFEPMEKALEFQPTLEDYFLFVVREKRGGVVL
ncbi:ABC transporter ATP-binding protein [Oscillospiraceae bacterium DSM 107454]|uniref:ABC transporter ATP-binding protein n=2 Tax=Ructibacterium gallinarum TaxID=2779355 RepID=A0A9D5LYA2_9FIRM|nr:ABC transporter ATP-binding protein [Ructibacterium gallinarum]MBE5040218.1 ABC transporter ATP-binding protein [Ructibacterium gallinarum]